MIVKLWWICWLVGCCVWSILVVFFVFIVVVRWRRVLVRVIVIFVLFGWCSVIVVLLVWRSVIMSRVFVVNWSGVSGFVWLIMWCIWLIFLGWRLVLFVLVRFLFVGLIRVCVRCCWFCVWLFVSSLVWWKICCVVRLLIVLIGGLCLRVKLSWLIWW